MNYDEQLAWIEDLEEMLQRVMEALSNELELTECLSKWGDECDADEELCSVCAKWEILAEAEEMLDD